MTGMKRNNGERPPAERRARSSEMSDGWLLDLVDEFDEDQAPEPEIEIEDLYRMMSDIMTGKMKPHIETNAGWEAWRTLEKEIADIKRQGGVVDFPAL